MRIGVFGGSFDPVHHGHLVVARALREALALDEVRLVPVAEQPFKAGRHRAGAPDRLRMVELAVGDEPGLVADATEVRRGGASYTVETLRELAGRHPGAALTLLLGSDAAAELPAWRDAAAIPALAEVVVFARSGDVPPRPGAVPFRVVPAPAVELSATDVRQRARQGRSLRYLVPDAVAEYIAARGLYRGEDG